MRTKYLLPVIMFLIAAMILQSVQPLAARAETGIMQIDPSKDFDTFISGFEADNDIWSYSYGDSSKIKGSYQRTVLDAVYGAGYAGLMSADFSEAPSGGNAFVSMGKSVSAVDVQELSFWMYSQDLRKVRVRVVDSTGQIFQHNISISSGGWQQVKLTQMQSSTSWGGANDKVWHAPMKSFSILLDRQDIKNGTLAASMLVDRVTASTPVVEPEVPKDYELLISGFETGTDGWSYSSGDNQPNITGSFQRIQGQAQAGDYAGKLSGDFSSGDLTRNTNVSMTKAISSLDVTQLALWVRTTDLRALKLRLVDGTGQTFQHSLALAETADWQQLKLTNFKSANSWGGANDKVWQGPLKSVTIMIDRPDIKNGTLQASLLVDQLTFGNPSLYVVQDHLGNVYHDNESVTLNVYSRGDSILWSAADFWGNTAGGGTVPVQNGQAALSMGLTDIGYYTMNIQAMQGGSLLDQKNTTLAVLGPAPDLHQVEDFPFGIMTHFDPAHGWPVEVISLVQEAGIKNIRDEVRWSNVEKVKGQYAFADQYEAYMGKAEELGIDPLIVLGFNNGSYDGGVTPYTAEGLEGFGSYGQAVLEHFGGQIKEVEIYNEFNWTFSSGPCAQDTACYFRMLKAAYEKVKETGDVAVIGPVTAGLPWGWMEELFGQHDEDGSALDFLDGVSIHPYRFPGSPKGMEDEINRLQQLIKTYNNGQYKPIWVSEWGWPTQTGATGVSESTQASYLVQSTVKLLAAGVEKMYWYDLMNKGTKPADTEDNFGIIRHYNDALGKYAPKPAYLAYAGLTRELTGADFQQREQTMPDGVWSYRFERDGSPVRVMWADTPTVVGIETAAPLVVTDLMGKQQTLTPVQGKALYQLTGYPVYVHGQIGSVSLDKRFSVEAAGAAVGEPVNVTLKVNNQDNTSPLTVEFRLHGTPYSLTAGAGQVAQMSVQIPGAATEQSLSFSTEVYIGGERVAVLTNTVSITPVMDTSIRHVVRDTGEALSLEVFNHSAQANTLSRVDWTIGSSSGTVEPDVTVAALSRGVYDLPLPSLAAGTYSYQLVFTWSDGQTKAFTGKVISADLAALTPVLQGTPDLNENPLVDLEQDGNFAHLSGYQGADDLSGGIWLHWDEDNFYLYADIKDNVHSQPETGTGVWQGDSIQFGVSQGLPGENVSMYELGMSLTADGPQFYRWVSMNGQPAELVTEGVQLEVTRDEAAKITKYRLALPWEELAPVKPSDTLFSFSILVNDNDGQGRRGWVEWGSGIGGSKTTSVYKGMRFVPMP